MSVKKIGRRFFYLHTTGHDTLKVTAGLTSILAFISLAILSIIKKSLFPKLQVSLLVVFSSFMILSFVINHFNYKFYKKHIVDFTAEWNNETRKNKNIYRICNVAFTASVFLILIFILKYLDNKNGFL